ncbi:hypothetical protein BH18ACT4_BH18ACT4_08350 [soil metagenome]
MTGPRTGRSKDTAAGGGGAALRGALIIGLAVVLGIVLLGKGLDSGILPSSSDQDDDTTDVATGEGGSIDETTTTSEAVARVPAEVKVYVLNGAGAPGLAGTGTDRVASAGYQTAPAENVPDGQDVAASAVYYVDGFEADANAVATVLGLPIVEGTVQPLPTPVPPAVPDGDVRGSNVIAVLGPDAPLG